MVEQITFNAETTPEKKFSKTILDDVTIIIPTLGREILRVSLAHIARASAWPAALIVVAQGGGPAVQKWVTILSSFGIEASCIASDQVGRAAGLNRGIENVRTRFFAITDDDCFVEPDWLANMTTWMRAHPLSIVTGRVEADGEGLQVVVQSRDPAIFHKPRLKFDTLSGGNMGTSVDVIARVGLYDEDLRLRTSEDGEWAYRALRAGIPIIYAPEVCVVHYGWRDESQRSSQLRGYARSHGGFYGKYIRKGDGFIALRAVIHQLRALKRTLVGVITRDRALARHGWAYFIGMPPGILDGLRHRDQP